MPFNEIYQSRIFRATIGNVPGRLIARFASAMVQDNTRRATRLDPRSGAVSPVRGAMGMGATEEKVVGIEVAIPEGEVTGPTR
jgi:hypothetical protein